MYRDSEETRLVHGDEAIVLGALDAGIKVFAGYPITPASEISELCSQLLPKYGRVFIQMEDEIASIAVAIGASVAGGKAMTATSGPGFSLMQENIGYAVMTEIPVVIVNMMRFGPSTGMPTEFSQQDVFQARWGTHGDYEMLVLAPSSVQECYDFTIKAFNLAERFMTPVVLLGDGILAHLREKLVLPPTSRIKIYNRKKPTCPPEEYEPYKPDEKLVPTLAPFGTGYKYNITGLTHNWKGAARTNARAGKEIVERLHMKFHKFREEFVDYDLKGHPEAKLVILSYGITHRSAEKAFKVLTNRYYKVADLKINNLWPFPYEFFDELPSTVEKILVVEHNWGKYYREVERYALKRGIEVHSLTRYDGTIISSEEIVEKAEEFLK